LRSDFFSIFGAGFSTTVGFSTGFSTTVSFLVSTFFSACWRVALDSALTGAEALVCGTETLEFDPVCPFHYQVVAL